MIVDFEDPGFELHKEVWVVCGPNSIIKTHIGAFQCLVTTDHDKIVGFAREVQIYRWIYDDYFNDMYNTNIIPLKYITKDENKAKEWMKVYPVSMTEEEWLLVIGERGKDEIGIEDCELGICCANISKIRDCLIKCKDKGGLIGWEIEDLKWKIETHEIPTEHKLLDKIFTQLQVEWK